MSCCGPRLFDADQSWPSRFGGIVNIERYTARGLIEVTGMDHVLFDSFVPFASIVSWRYVALRTMAIPQISFAKWMIRFLGCTRSRVSEQGLTPFRHGARLYGGNAHAHSLARRKR